MGYIESNLDAGEFVVAYGQVHWIAYMKGLGLILIGVAIFVDCYLGYGLKNWQLTVILFFIATGIISFLNACARVESTELAVTNKRIIAKFGMIRRHTMEVYHSKIEGFRVEQGLVGRIFNFGTIIVNGTGAGHAPIPQISNPLEFRKKAMLAIDQLGVKAAQ